MLDSPHPLSLSLSLHLPVSVSLGEISDSTIPAAAPFFSWKDDDVKPGVGLMVVSMPFAV